MHFPNKPDYNGKMSSCLMHFPNKPDYNGKMSRWITLYELFFAHLERRWITFMSYFSKENILREGRKQNFNSSYQPSVYDHCFQCFRVRKFLALATLRKSTKLHASRLTATCTTSYNINNTISVDTTIHTKLVF